MKMTENTLSQAVEEMIPSLLDLARSLTWNKISDNCRFVLTEIKESKVEFHSRQKLVLNGLKEPVTFEEIIQLLQQRYENLYDINLYIYRSEATSTIIEIQYYPKSALDQAFRKQVLHHPPMLHCKVNMPPWISKGKKFDINWAHKPGVISRKLFWMKLKLRATSIFRRC